MGRLIGALVGAGFFVWIAGTRALDPAEIGWLMRYDWPIHFFGWHFFRGEGWHWPPGLIHSYYAPMGTSIGFTDSIPLVAFALKPFHAWLPATFQYIGAWLLLCFALQGVFGAWLMSQWTPHRWVQVSGAALLVLMPTLLIRIGHPALCAHWLLLWVLVIAARGDAGRFRAGEWAALGLMGGLLHPYLAVMALAMLSAVALTPASRAFRARVSLLVLAGAATLLGWWAAGLFSVSGAESMATEGFGYYSMNLLGPFTHAGWSSFLPDIARATPGQDFEGFQYLGLGTFLMLMVAAATALRVDPRATGPGQTSARVFAAPLFVVALVLAIYALSPRITAGSTLILDATGAWTERLAVFRATGRFFWPLGYLLIAWALGTLARRLPSRVALTLLLTFIVLQALDLHGAHEARRRSARDAAFYAWVNPMVSPVWSRVLPEYDHLVLYPPPQCGTAPMPWEPAAYLAGLHGLTLNAGGVARPDDVARLQYCHELGDQLKAGQIDPRSFYLVLPSEVEALRRAATPPAVCGIVDTLSVCVSAGSYERWRDLAILR